MDISAFRTNPKLEQEGVWVPIGEGARLKIARAGNEAAKKKWEQLISKPGVRRAMRRGALPEKESLDMWIDLLATAVLLDWEGLVENGKPIPYSTDKARELLQLKDFRDLVQECATDMQLFRDEIVAESVAAVKKS